MSRIAVVGLGSIGGSVALGSGARGWDRDEAVRERARRRGIAVAEDLAGALEGAELVVLAAPTGAIPGLLEDAARLAPDAVLTDCASLKRPVVAAAARLPQHARCVAGHPMAGGRAAGIDGADGALFRGRPWAIVRPARSDDDAVAAVERLVCSLGARPVPLEAERHDRLMTWISHLPLAVAAALARAASDGGGDDLARLAGPGLRDTTRLASTAEPLALELALADPGPLADAIDAVAGELRSASRELRAGDADALAAFLAGAR
ncbi:MAG: prephenate dehydrogenase, partial [Syntrophomonadaceae bacterium]